MEGANQPGIGSGGDEYHHIGDDFDVPIDPDFERLMLEEDDRLGKLGSLHHQPSFDPFNDGPDVGSVDSSTTVATGSEGSTTKTQERKRRKNEVSFDISSDDVLRFSALSRRDAASKLKVSESTLKRVCRIYGIQRWPPRGKNKEKERFPVAEPSAGDILPLDSPEESLLMERDSTINVAHDVRADHSWPSISHLEHESLLTLEDPRQQLRRRREYAAKSLGGELDSTGGSLDQPSVDAFKDGPDVSSVNSDTTVGTSSEGSTTKTQERKRKKKGVRFDISYDDVLRLSALSRGDAASKLEVSESTLQRVCRKYGIHRWPPRGKNKEERFLVAVPSTGDIVPLDSPGDIGITWWPYQQNGRGAVAREKTGVRIEIPLEDVVRYSNMRLDDAARKLKVCSSTLKRICRDDYGIHRWPPRNINMDGSPWPSHVKYQEGISQSTSNQVSAAYFVETSRIPAASR